MLPLTDNETARLIAALGPDWTAEPINYYGTGRSTPDSTMLRGPDDQRIRAEAPGEYHRPVDPATDDGTQRIHLTTAFEGEIGAFQQRHASGYGRDYRHEITVARSRGPEVWAREIQRRLLPEHQYDLARLHKQKAGHEAYVAAQVTLVERMRVAGAVAGLRLLGAMREGETALSLDHKTRPQAPGFPRYFDVDVKVSIACTTPGFEEPDHVDMKLQGVPVDLAESILRLIGERVRPLMPQQQVEAPLRYVRRATTIQAERATASCEIQTLEGPQHVTVGDWIVTGVEGERYSMPDAAFRARYVPGELPGTYTRIQERVTARKANANEPDVVTNSGRVLHVTAGDMIVTQADGDRSVVKEGIFRQTYEAAAS